jgi:hypothetical protein
VNPVDAVFYWRGRVLPDGRCVGVVQDRLGVVAAAVGANAAEAKQRLAVVVSEEFQKSIGLRESAFEADDQAVSAALAWVEQRKAGGA